MTILVSLESIAAAILCFRGELLFSEVVNNVQIGTINQLAGVANNWLRVAQATPGLSISAVPEKDEHPWFL